jgi:hypothetical protein
MVQTVDNQAINESVLNLLPQGVCLMDCENNVLFTNKNLENLIHNFKKEELVKDLFSFVNTKTNNNRKQSSNNTQRRDDLENN